LELSEGEAVLLGYDSVVSCWCVGSEGHLNMEIRIVYVFGVK